MARPRLLVPAVAAVVCGLPSVAPLPAAQAGPGTWATSIPSTAAFDNLSAFPDGTAYATIAAVASSPLSIVPGAPSSVGGQSTGYLKSTDYGVTWVPMAPPPVVGGFTARNLHVRFATPDIGYATYSSREDVPQTRGPLSRTMCLQLSSTFRTTDGGTTWTPLCEPQPVTDTWAVRPAPSPLAVGSDGTTVMHLGYEDGPEGSCEPLGVVHLSTDAGQSWRRWQLPGNWQPGFGARVYDRNTAAVIAYRWDIGPGCTGLRSENAVFLTTDGGRSYRRVLSCPVQPYCTSVAFVTRTRLIVGKTDGSTTISNDGGRRWLVGQRLWSSVNDPAVASDPDLRHRHWVQSFAFADPKNGYASTRGGGTWRTSDGGRSWTQEASHECVYHQWGVGENAVFDADRALTGGPAFISTRAPGAVSAPCQPPAQQAPVSPAATVAVAGGVTVRADGTFVRQRS